MKSLHCKVFPFRNREKGQRIIADTSLEAKDPFDLKAEALKG